MGLSDDELCLKEAEMTDCVSRTERSSDVSGASVTTASSSEHQGPGQASPSLMKEKMQVRTWRLGVGKEARRQRYLSPRATFQRPGACSEGLLRRIPRLACAFHRVAGTRDALGVMGAKKGHPL
jgi:hypothetical protein